MQILNCPNDQSGFSLLECIIALGILAIVMGGMMSVQTSVLRITQTAVNKNKADLVLNSAMAQVEYILDAYGQTNFPSGAPNIPAIPPDDSQFKTTVTNTEVKNNGASLKLSDVIVPAIKIFYTVAEAGEQLPEDLLALIPNIVDSHLIVHTNNFINIEAKTKWTQGKSDLSVFQTIFMINTQAISITGQ